MDTSNISNNIDDLAIFSEDPPSNVVIPLNTPIADCDYRSSDLGDSITKSDCENPSISPPLEQTSLLYDDIHVSVEDMPTPQLSTNLNISNAINNIEKSQDQLSEIRSPKRIKLSTTGFLNIAMCNHSEH